VLVLGYYPKGLPSPVFQVICSTSEFEAGLSGGDPKDEGLAANVKDSMDAGGMAAADVTQASEQAKSREFLTKHRFKEP